jgi:hypothetical protein
MLSLVQTRHSLLTPRLKPVFLQKFDQSFLNEVIETTALSDRNDSYLFDQTLVNASAYLAFLVAVPMLYHEADTNESGNMVSTQRG